MRKLFQLGLIIALFVSCNKDENSDLFNDPLSKTKEYFPLEVGNYWVYQTYLVDTLGKETNLATIDSVVITRQEIYNGNSYYIFEGTNSPLNKNFGFINALRDSSGYIVDKNGLIRFTAINFIDTLLSQEEIFENDTLYTLTFKMEEISELVSVPAGKFEVLNFKGTLIARILFQNTKKPRYINKFYAKGVGKILDSYYYLSHPSRSEKRLIRYHIEKNK